jgi:hypothetical protein
MVAAVVDATNSGDDKDAVQKAEQAVMTIGSNFLSQTYMSSLSDLMNMLSEPERYAGSFIEKIGAALVTPMSAATRTAAQLVDRTVREPQGFVDQLKSGIPGLSKQVQPKVATIGGDVERNNIPWFPINSTPSQDTTLTRELNRLEYNFGQVTNRLDIGGKDPVELTPKDYTTLKRLFSEMVEKNIKSLLISPAYLNANDEYRKSLLDKAVSNARDTSRNTMRALLPTAEKQRLLLEQQAAQTRTLEQTNPAAARKIIFQNPQILAFREQQALQALASKA